MRKLRIWIQDTLTVLEEARTLENSNSYPVEASLEIEIRVPTRDRTFPVFKKVLNCFGVFRMVEEDHEISFIRLGYNNILFLELLQAFSSRYSWLKWQ